MNYQIEKPDHYKSARIVYDKQPLLVVNLTNTLHQMQMPLAPSYAEFEMTERETHIIITEL
jgi:hypothetical protein